MGFFGDSLGFVVSTMQQFIKPQVSIQMKEAGALVVPLKHTHNQTQFTVQKMKNALFKYLTTGPTQMM